MRAFLDNTLSFLESIEMSPREALYLVTIIQLIILLYWKMVEQGNAPKWVKVAVGVLSTLAMIINVLAIIIYTML
jgi:hypothetical protein